jgi:hypothetical protein
VQGEITGTRRQLIISDQRRLAMYSENPLNPTLFRSLESYYGVGNVEIVSNGVAIRWRTLLDWVPGTTEKRLRRHVDVPGEEYKVRCRICQDYRARMYINHHWGVFDQETQTRNLWLINCFNEDCYSEYDARRELYQRIYGVQRNRGRVPILEGRKADDRVICPMSPPGMMWRLDKWRERHPRSEVVKYLEDRHFDVDKLGRLWGLCYCADSNFYFARDRIIIPIYWRRQMVGWQARYIGDDVDGVPFNKARVPKYYTSPGCPKKLVGYNFDRAVQHSTVVIVEGPADAWSTGPMAIGLLGKTMSSQLQYQLVEEMQRQHGKDGVVVICLDPKPDPGAAARGKPHHIDRLVSQLMVPMEGRIVPVWLPEEHDPGSMDRVALRELITQAAADKELVARFTKPTTKST